MAKQFFPDAVNFDERAKLVKEGDTLNTGRHTFTFVMAPMVHWPEVMVTYDTTDKILFSADAFGAFGALNGAIFADEVNFERDYLDEARAITPILSANTARRCKRFSKKLPVLKFP